MARPALSEVARAVRYVAGVAESEVDDGAVVERLTFAGRELKAIDEYTEIQRAVLPVIGIRADGIVEGLGTAYCVCDSPSVLISARHVIEAFIRANRADLMAGTASIQVVWETNKKNPDMATDLGAPVPLYRTVFYTPSKVEHGQEWLGPPDESERGVSSDLAVLLPFGVQSGDREVGPSPSGPLGFSLPVTGAWVYAIGYPEMSGKIGVMADGGPVINWTRTPTASAGHVVRPYPEGQPGNLMVQGPSFDMDMELPHGMSGAPILSDGLGICAVASAAIDPLDPSDRWAAYATGLEPVLDLPLFERMEGGMLTLRHLINGGAVRATGAVPAPPLVIPPATIVSFPEPAKRPTS